jgi:hypothetical protein
VPDLNITIEGAEAVPFTVAPMLGFKLRVANADPAEEIHTVVLRCQVQIEATRRGYTPEDQERLRDLFGEPERWSQTLRNLLWTNNSTVVPRFTGRTTAELQVPCTFDFAVATTKYLSGLTDGDIPVCVMFSGTVFYADQQGGLHAAPIPWDKEAKFRLPVQVWRDMMETFYPNSSWLQVRRDVFEELRRFKMQRGLPSWEEAFQQMLHPQKAEAMRA